MAELAMHRSDAGVDSWTRRSSVCATRPSKSSWSSWLWPDPGGTVKHVERQRQLWEDLFSDWSQWWDNRVDNGGLVARDVVAWNAMLTAYAQVGLAEKVLELYQLMMEEEGAVNPDARTFVSTLQAYGMLAEKDPHTVVMDGLPVKTESLNRGRAVHVHSWKNGFDSDALVAAKLVTLYGKCGAIVDAELYEQMLLEESVSPDERPFAQSLLHTTLARSLEQGRVIHAKARRNGYDSDACVGSTLVSLYGMSGSTADAQIVFDGLSNRNVVSWTAILAAYVHQSRAFQRRL